MKAKPLNIDNTNPYIAMDRMAQELRRQPLLNIETTKAHLDQIRDMQEYYPEILSHFQAIVKQLTGLVRLNTKSTVSCD